MIVRPASFAASIARAALIGADYSDLIIIETNVPADDAGVFRFLNNGVANVLDVSKSANGQVWLSRGMAEAGYKVLFLPFARPGVWVLDALSWQEGMTAVTFTEPPGAEVAPTHYIAGQCLKNGQPFAGEVHAVRLIDASYLGAVVADPATGVWRLEFAGSGAVYAMVSDNYGTRFSAGAAVSVGDFIHPSAANQFVYEVIQGGVLPQTEPVAWETGGSFALGTAVLDPKPFPAPQIHGPIVPTAI